MRHFPLLLFIWSALCAPSSIAGKPNLVLIITDDQGYGALACNGHPWVKTPHLDKLHAEAVALDD